MALALGQAHLRLNLSHRISPPFPPSTLPHLNAAIHFGHYSRLPYAGEAGQRNDFRGDGYFDIDASLRKTWTVLNKYDLMVSAEAYNITNTDRFDVSLAGLIANTSSPNLGNYTSLLSQYRLMQFGLRLQF
jgi:hypothetical protein